MKEPYKRIGILKETRPYPEGRVPLTPLQARFIQDQYPHIEVFVQPSSMRAFCDEEYAAQGIALAEDLSHCDLLMGVKQVAVPTLIPDKTYLFFSHTVKLQPDNRALLQAVLEHNITLLDYELLTNDAGQRVAAFGRYAGVVGAYNGLIGYGLKQKSYTLPRAYTCVDQQAMNTGLARMNLPPMRIALTGGGRVAGGAIETLEAAGIRRVSVADFLVHSYAEPIYAQIHSSDYCVRRDTGKFDKEDFYRTPRRYRSTFIRYARVADLLIAGAYWDPKAPVLFTRADMQSPDFAIQMIADVTCDINGSIPSTKRATTITEPFCDYNPETDQLIAPFSHAGHPTMMAIDNLPCELPRSASEDFGHQLLHAVAPALAGVASPELLQRATIAEHGSITPQFAYLERFVAHPSASEAAL